MFDFLENDLPENAEHISEERLQKIKAYVSSQMNSDRSYNSDKEEKPMKKRTTFKALLVAAAVMTTGAISVIGASAEMNRTAADPIAPPAQVDNITPAASAPKETTEVPETPAELETPDVPKNPEIPETPAEPETPESYTDYEAYRFVERITNLRYRVDIINNLSSKGKPEISNLTSSETEINGYKVTVIKYEVDGKKKKMIRQSNDDMELIEIKEDGTRVYKTFSGIITSERSANSEYKGQGYFCEEYSDV